jgi:hypothetical protein
MAYSKEAADTPAYQAYKEATDILGTFTPEQIRRVNESDDINKAIPDVMTDRTGQQLLEALRELKNMTLRYEE